MSIRFEKVILHFLIVGHTHCIIDQYFSIISKRIFKAEFIASPYALHALIMQEASAKEIAKSEESGNGKKVVVPKICKAIEVLLFSFLLPW